MMKSFFLVLLLTILLFRRAGAQPAPALGTESVSLSSAKWEEVLAQFEDSVGSLSKWLEKARVDRKKNQAEIDALEKKTTALRESTKKSSNVFEEIRLKGLLNDLKTKLDEGSALQHQWDDQLKDFQQKALSLTALYNDRIEAELEKADPSTDPSRLNSEINALTGLIQKRNHIQSLLREYQAVGGPERPELEGDLGSLKSDDRENLQLAMDLLRDRKKELGERIEKGALEEEEVKNELKLQGKMQEFLEDIQRMNEDSDLPQGSLKRNDLEGVAGKGEQNKLEKRLADIKLKALLDGQLSAQTDQMMEKVQNQMDALNARKK